MLDEEKSRLQATLNTIKTTDENLSVRSNLIVDGNIKAKGIILDDESSKNVMSMLYPNLNQEIITNLIEQLSQLNKNKQQETPLEIKVEDVDSKKIRTITLVKDTNNFFKADIIILNGTMKIIKKYYHEGLKDLKLIYKPENCLLNFEFKSKQKSEDFSLTVV